MQTSPRSLDRSPRICTACGTHHNERLTEALPGEPDPLVDIASKLRDEHFADELHPNDEGAQVIAQEVFRVLSEVRQTEDLGRRAGHVLDR